MGPRPSIHTKPLGNQRPKDYAAAQGRSMSGLCEEFIADKLDAFAQGDPPIDDPKTPPPEPATPPQPAVPDVVEDDDTARELGEPDEVADVPPSVMYL